LLAGGESEDVSELRWREAADEAMTDRADCERETLYATFGEVAGGNDQLGRTVKTAAIETSDEGRLSVEEILGGRT
jgi:hypothetical protein